VHKRKMTCIVCPVGCRLDVETDDSGGVLSVSGNTCARGEKYAVSETTNPVRTLTSTIHISGAEESLLPVKTAEPIPKDRLRAAMEVIRSLAVTAPVNTGDVVATFDGVGIVACKTIPGKAV
jgi:CxxC motif-containing protein